MNEYIYAEFLFAEQDINAGMSMLRELGDDFVIIKSDQEFDLENSSPATFTWVRISGKMNSVAATAITLGNTFLSKRMRTSHIPTHLKDMYRK